MSATIDPTKLKVQELKNELSARGLDTKGNKPDLVARLSAELARSASVPNTSAAPQQTTPATAISPAPTTITQPQTAPQQLATQPPSQAPLKPAQVASTPVEPSPPAQPNTQPIEQAPSATPAVVGEVEEEPVYLSQMSDEERKKVRAERFGIPQQHSEAAKKAERAARFGLPLSKSTEIKNLNTDDKLEARKKRFGIVEQQNKGKGSVNVGKAQRLGLPVKEASATDVAKLEARKLRFSGGVSKSTNEEDEKKRKRLERFAGTAAAVSSDAKRLRVDKPLEQQTNA